MNSKASKKSILFRKVISLGVLIALLGTYSFFDPWQASAANQPNQINQKKQAYVWNRCYSEDELQDNIAAALGRTTRSTDYSYANDNDWARVLIAYQSGNTWYYLDSSGKPGTGHDGFPCAIVSNTFGCDFTKDQFKTRTGMNTLYIKRTTGGQCSDYDRFQPQFSLRFCKAGTEAISPYFVGVFLEMYGIKYHAITDEYFDFTLTATGGGKSDYSVWSSNRDHLRSSLIRFAPSWKQFFTDYNVTLEQKNALMVAYEYKIEKNRWVYTTAGAFLQTYYIDPSDEEKVAYALANCKDKSLYDTSVFTKTYKPDSHPYGVTGVAAYKALFKDKCKQYKNSQTDRADEGTAYFYYDFDCDIYERNWHQSGSTVWVVDGDTTNTSFYIYVGTPSGSTTTTQNYQLEQGKVYYWENNFEIPSGKVVTVPKGTTVIIPEKCFNNGRIRIAGGTVIVAGVIMTDSDAKATTETQPGDIEVSYGGYLLVTNEGAILQSNLASNLAVFNNGSVELNGVAVVSNLSLCGYSYMLCNPGTALSIGSPVNQAVDIDTFNSKNLWEKRDYPISSFINTSLTNAVALRLSGSNNFFYSGGLVYLASQPEITGSDYLIDCWRESDYRRTIVQGMRGWGIA